MLLHLCSLWKNLKRSRCRPDWMLFFLAVRGADIDLQYTKAMRERAETLRSLEVCKSYSVLWVLPTFDLMLISPTACWASVITCCPKQQNPSSSVENDAFCLVPKELLFPVYQLSENLHFNWILMFEPNYTYWVTGAPSEKRLTGLKCKCSEDDGQSEPLTSTMQNLTSCAKIAHSAVTRNIFPTHTLVCVGKITKLQLDFVRVHIYPSACMCFNEFECARIFMLARGVHGTCVKTEGN